MTRAVLLSVLPAFLSAGIVSAQAGDIDVVYKGPGRVETRPRESVVLVFLVENRAQETREYSSFLTLPTGWRSLAEDDVFTIPAGEVDLRLSSFFIPENTEAGIYPVRYTVSKKDDETIRASHDAFVTVLPYIRFDIEVQEAPRYVLAGSEIATEFLIRNRSNQSALLRVTVASSEKYALTSLDGEFEVLEFSYQQSRVLRYVVQTDPFLNRPLKHRLRLIGQIVSEQAESRDPMRVESVVDVIPRMSQGGDRFNRIPLEVTAAQSNSVDEESWDATAQAKIDGAGFLDEAREHYVELFIDKHLGLPPETFSYPGDTYRARYRYDFLDLVAGDAGYSLSPLVEKYRYGRGGGAGVDFGFLGFGAYYHQSHWLDPVRHHVGGYTSLFVPDPANPEKPTFRASVNVFSLIGQSIILSLYQRVRPVPELALDWELAVELDGTEANDLAALAGIHGDHGWISYSVDAIFAEPEYRGYYGDLFFLSGGVNLSFLQNRLRFDGLLQREVHNLLLNAALPSAPLSWTGQLGTGVTIPDIETDLGLQWRIRSGTDILHRDETDSLVNTWKLSGRQPLGLFALQIMAFVEVIGDLTNETTTLGQEYTAALRFAPAPFSSFQLLLLYKGLIDPEINVSHRLGWEFVMNLRIGIFNLTFLFQNDYQFQNELFAETGLKATLDLAFLFDEMNRLSAKAAYDLSGLPELPEHEIKFSIEYTHTFGIPVGRRSGLGAVRGVVRDVETGEAMPNIVVRLGRYAMATDAGGGFMFPTLVPGTYYIDTDTSLIETDLAPLGRTPVEVRVEEQQDTELEIHYGLPADLDGTITIYEFNDAGQQFESSGQEQDTGEAAPEGLELTEGDEREAFSAKGGLAGILIEITDGRATHRRVTNEKGYFIFEDLPPGNWTLKVSSALVPEYHYVETDLFELELSSGATETLAVRVLPEKRTMQIINEGEILLESD